MVTVVGLKRGPSLAELLEPLHKRHRQELLRVALQEEIGGHCHGHPALVAAVTAVTAVGAVAFSERRRPREQNERGLGLVGRDGEGLPSPRELPGCAAAQKRPRLLIGELGASVGDGVVAEGGACARGGGPGREVALRAWAEAMVRALHGCPSIDAAMQRCTRLLSDVDAEARQAALLEHSEREQAVVAEREAAEAATSEARGGRDGEERPPDTIQGLVHTKGVLMRAVHHLAERCRRLEASDKEVAVLTQALQQAEEAKRRLAHSNEVLQGHLRLHLDSCRPWPP